MKERIINFKLIKFSVVLCMGIFIGIIARWDSDLSSPEEIALVQKVDTVKAAPSVAHENQQYSQELKLEVITLRKRVLLLEQELIEQRQTGNSITANTSSKTIPAKKLTLENLLKAGVTEMIAEDIINRMSQHKFLLLELQNHAKREGRLNSSSYFKERRKLMQIIPSVRKAIGNDAYDRYLYETAQNNRVIVRTVMKGSPAEQLGVQNGDIILTYANEKVLTRRDLPAFTTEGTVGEYVNLNILREGKLQNIVIPRGPLGVTLSKAILDPQTEYNY